MLFMASWLVLAYRLASIQVLNRHDFQEKASRQHHREVTLPARRGDIVDRRGRLVAADRLLHTVGVHPRLVEDPSGVAGLLSTLAGESPEHWTGEIGSHDRFFYVIRRGELNTEPPPRHELPQGLEIVEEYRRSYPRRTLAASVLGYVGTDGKGLDGLEFHYENLLRGEPGHLVQQVDAVGAAIPGMETESEEPVDGLTLHLTIDAVIQEILEDELERGVIESEASGASAVALDPVTGAVLAMATFPSFDPNVQEEAEAATRRNRTVTDPFEPGSVAKIVTFAAALDVGRFTPADTIDGGNGVIQVVGSEINDTRPHGKMSLGEVLQFSSNVGTVKIARTLGENQMYRYARDFGFGQATGVDLPGEAGGLLRRLPEWRGPALESLSIGYGLSVTTVQVASAYAAVANGGRLMRPYVVDSVEDSQGRRRIVSQPEVIRRVMHEETSDILRGFLRKAVLEGTGDRAAVPGLEVAGKTGTARKVSDGGYQAGAYISSFCGFLPADDPKLLLLVVIDEPAGGYYARDVAAPVFARTVRRLMSHPERPIDGFKPPVHHLVERADPLVPDLRRWPAGEAGRALTRRGLRVRYVGEGPTVITQEPAPFVEAEEGVVVALHLGVLEAGPVGAESPMPDLRGLTLREAAIIAWEIGLELNADGSGMVIRQEPAPGRQVRVGTVVSLYASGPGRG
jgi:cell division protein FtsI/penicillin-binding protein 2